MLFDLLLPDDVMKISHMPSPPYFNFLSYLPTFCLSAYKIQSIFSGENIQ